MRTARPRRVCAKGWARSRSFASQQQDSLGSGPKKPTCLAQPQAAPSGLPAERMVRNGENRPSLHRPSLRKGKILLTITNWLNKTAGKEVMWCEGVWNIFKMQPNALASPTSQAGFDFSSCGPGWPHTSSCWGRFAGAGSERGDCCALCVPVPLPSSTWNSCSHGGKGLVWGGAVPGWGWHSCEWPGEELLLTWWGCSWRRGESTAVWCGEWSWSVGLESSFHCCSVADEQQDQVLFQCLGQNGLLSCFIFFLEYIVSLNFFHSCLSYFNRFPDSFSLFKIF